MSLYAEYSPPQDRMLLELEAAEGVRAAFWITRRQWLSLVHRLRRLHPAPAVQENEEPPARRKKRERPPVGRAVKLLDAIRVRPSVDGVNIALVAGDQVMTLNMNGTSLDKLLELLLSQAERAGWDVAAAQKRLTAEQLANSVVRRASRMPEK